MIDPKTQFGVKFVMELKEMLKKWTQYKVSSFDGVLI